ncbi:hypothetical protein DPMN_140897 [Dreissena polymorpha]|uniref:Uncharacterized protein n=1 Tax=Dreissena polymorpha TaxID=45954 RepID=A0A9D4JJE5_DREPO|nr:hypothetical protein DPMN_140897 [Dreissena polymorpha]
MNSEHPGGHVFQQTGYIFFHGDWTINAPFPDNIGTILVTKLHTDQTINAAPRVLTRQNSTPPDIIGTNLLTKFHDDRTINMASRMQTMINLLTKFHEDRTINEGSRVRNVPPPGGHVFQATETMFKLVQDTIGANFLTKFHDDRTINVASKVLTRFYYSHIRINAPPPGGHVFQSTGIIFKFVQDIIWIKLVTKFLKDWTINVASRGLTSHIRKNAPPIGSHFFFKQTKNDPPPGGHVFQPTGIIFLIFQDIIEMNLLTKFNADRTINVASRVLTRF